MATLETNYIVHCKDCKYAWHSTDGLRCERWSVYDTDCITEPEAFCSYGEEGDINT